MSKISNILALATMVLGAACTGTGSFGDGNGGGEPGVDAGGGGGTEVAAREIFDNDVAPLLQTMCASCHVDVASAPGNALKFLGPEGTEMTDYYNLVVGYPSVTGGFEPGLASIVTKGAHEGSGWWTPDQEATIEGWLEAEKAERADGSGGGGGDEDPVDADSRQLLAQWSGCMTIANWDAADMGDWADKNAEGGTVCSSCHNDGLHRFNTNTTNNDMFAMNRYELFIIGFFTVKLNLDGTGEIIPAYDKLERMGNGTTLHPTFNYCSAEQVENGDCNDDDFLALEQFHQLTNQALAQGACGPAEFPPVP